MKSKVCCFCLFQSLWDLLVGVSSWSREMTPKEATQGFSDWYSSQNRTCICFHGRRC